MGSNDENRNNYDAAKNFFEAYFQKIYVDKLQLSTSLDEDLFLQILPEQTENGFVDTPVFQPFAQYLAVNVYTQTAYTFVVDLIFRLKSGGLGVVISEIRDYIVGEFKKGTIDFDEYPNPGEDLIKSRVQSFIGAGKFDINEFVKSAKDSALQNLAESLFGGKFEDTKVFDYITNTIIRYAEGVGKNRESYFGNEDVELAIDKAEGLIAEIYAAEAMSSGSGITLGEKYRLLQEEYLKFTEDFLTVTDIHHMLVNKVLDKLIEASCEAMQFESVYLFNCAEANYHYYKEYSNKPNNHDQNGTDGGHMEAFRQTYASAESAFQYGRGEQHVNLAINLKLQDESLAPDDLDQFKMDIWNSYVGQIIGEQVRAELGLAGIDFKEYSEDDHRRADNLIAAYTKAALELGVAVRSKEDLRLQFLNREGQDYYDFAQMKLDASLILDRAQGGVEGKSVIGLLKNFSNGSSGHKIDWAEVLGHAISDGARLGFLNNDTTERGRTIPADGAHRLLQFVQLSNYGPSFYGICDPASDPTPVDIDDLDNDASLRKAMSQGPVATFSEGNIVGNVYENQATYCIVFNDVGGGAFSSINQSRNAEAFVEQFLNPAYRVYRKLLETLPNRTVTLLGYDIGGAVASALSAALYHGAFTEDEINPVTGEKLYGHFDTALAYYGWSLDEDGGVINNYAAETVNAVTFSAPSVGWIFQKPELMEKDLSGKNVYTYEFDYQKGEFKRDKLLQEAPVTNYGMPLDPVFASERYLYASATPNIFWTMIRNSNMSMT